MGIVIFIPNYFPPIPLDFYFSGYMFRLIINKPKSKNVRNFFSLGLKFSNQMGAGGVGGTLLLLCLVMLQRVSRSYKGPSHFRKVLFS